MEHCIDVFFLGLKMAKMFYHMIQKYGRQKTLALLSEVSAYLHHRQRL